MHLWSELCLRGRGPRWVQWWRTCWTRLKQHHKN
jgi:hypothetical protein